MMGTNYPSPSYLPPNDGKDIIKEMVPILKDADVTFGNLEGALLNSGGTPKQCKNPDVCYVFRSPEHYVNNLVEAGFDFMSLANNHSGDFGGTGRSRTKEVLSNAGIGFAGLASTDEFTIITRDSIRYGLAAFAPNSGTCDLRNISYAKQLVSKLAANCDIVIVSFHGGAEGEKNQHVPKATETYYGENRGDVHAFAHAVIDAGADVVFGHGPHVPRAMEIYQDRIIAYSLGNFCTYGRFSLSGSAGFAPLLKVYVDAQGAFIQGEIVSIYQMKTHGPKLDSQNRALKRVAELTKADFPSSEL
ncbi:MAG: CapA family protein [Saprospirales bacterium]|nr:CapA family protein [Saprospirales bacterium]